MRLVLISPPNPLRPIPDREGLPLGLCMLGSMVRTRIDVRIIDAYSSAMTLDSTVIAALDAGPDIVGISLPYSLSEKSVVEIAGHLKSAVPNLPIVAGGVGATVRADALLESGFIDAVAIGEAETTIVDFVDMFVAGGIDAVRTSPPAGLNLPGKDGGPRALIENLDDLPFPSFDLLPGFPAEYSARLLTSRGCAYQCRYCSSCRFWGRAFRAHSPDRVVDDMKRLRDTWGIRRISFADDTFNIDRRRANAIAEKLISAGLDIEWGASSRPELLTDDDVRLFAKAGMTGLFLGLESGSPRVIESIGRSHDPEKARRLIELAEGLGIRTHASFMIGLPDETPEDIEMTIAYARSLPASTVGFHIFHPLPGSEYGDNPEKYGIRFELSGGDEDRIGAIDQYAVIRTKHLSPMQIIEYYDRARAVAMEKMRG
jgi:anaerobic magnesium-protoporphyrin IX monomethyl ester cyclase